MCGQPPPHRGDHAHLVDAVDLRQVDDVDAVQRGDVDRLPTGGRDHLGHVLSLPRHVELREVGAAQLVEEQVQREAPAPVGRGRERPQLDQGVHQLVHRAARQLQLRRELPDAQRAQGADQPQDGEGPRHGRRHPRRAAGSSLRRRHSVDHAARPVRYFEFMLIS